MFGWQSKAGVTRTAASEVNGGKELDKFVTIHMVLGATAHVGSTSPQPQNLELPGVRWVGICGDDRGVDGWELHLHSPHQARAGPSITSLLEA